MCSVKHPFKAKQPFTVSPLEISEHISDEIIEMLSCFTPKVYTILGGEPLISSHTPKILEMLSKQMERLDGKILLYTNGTLVNEEVAEILESFKIMVLISVEGDEDYTTYMRGRGVYQKAISAYELLKSHNIDVGLRAGFCRDNFQSIISFLKKHSDKIIELTPRTDRYPPSRNGMLYLFNMVSRMKSADILIPSYKNWLGLNIRCPALERRITVHPDGWLTPCQWAEERVAHITDDDDLIESAIERYLPLIRKVKSVCLTCNRATICYSSCRFSKDYLVCPVRSEDTDISESNERKLVRSSAISSIRRIKAFSVGGC
jgi:radical SAM protein with 4Fe4S-binding SPASM domain